MKMKKFAAIAVAACCFNLPYVQASNNSFIINNTNKTTIKDTSVALFINGTKIEVTSLRPSGYVTVGNQTIERHGWQGQPFTLRFTKGFGTDDVLCTIENQGTITEGGYYVSELSQLADGSFTCSMKSIR